MNDSNGSLIAVNYAARAAGVKRNHRGDEARGLCPDLQLVQVPTKHGKADLTLYRDAGKQVLKVLGQSDAVRVERASIDECYLDLTEEAHRRLAANGGVPPVPPRPQQVHIYGSNGESIEAERWWSRVDEAWGPGERLLAAGAAVVAELRANVESKLGYTCSAGIAHSRLLAKLCSGLHKPAQQTVVPAASVAALLDPLPLSKLRGLGGQFGKQVAAELGIETVGQLSAVTLNRLESTFGEKDGRWLFGLARGIDDGEVEERRLPKSVSCGKTFRGASALGDDASVHRWLLELAAELEERLAIDKEDNHRSPQLLTVSIGTKNGNGAGGGGVSRSCQLRRPEAAVMAADAAGLVRRWAGEQPSGWRITDLFLGVSNFVDVQATSITQFFKPTTAAAVVVASPSDQSRLDAAEGRLEDEPVQEKVDDQGESSIAVSNGRGNSEGDIDESVLAELPLEIQKEVRAALKMKDLMARASARGSKRQEAPQQTLKQFMFGKRPKR